MPNTPLNKEERSVLEHKIARIISSFNQYGKRTNGEKNDDANFLKYDGKFKQIMELIDNHVDAAIREARIDEAKEIRDNISELGSEVYFAVQRIDGHIKALQSQPNAKEGE